MISRKCSFFDHRNRANYSLDGPWEQRRSASDVVCGSGSAVIETTVPETHDAVDYGRYLKFYPTCSILAKRAYECFTLDAKSEQTKTRKINGIKKL